MKKYLVAALVALSLVFGSAAYADEAVQLKRVDEFSIILDQSGSMYMKDAHKHVKMAVAKEAIKNILDEVPALAYESSFALSSEDKELVKHGKLDKEGMLKALAKVKDEQAIFGRNTYLWSAIDKEGKDFCSISRKSAMILVTDGDSNRGENPVDTVKKLYAEKPNTTLHIISFADTPEGEKTIAELANLKEGTVVVPACELLKKENAKAFAEMVLYADYTPYAVTFDFDSYALDAEKAKKEFAELGILYDVAVVKGYTCTTGEAAYNDKLSLRRACALADAIGAKMAIGEGESTKYDKKALNRRAEVILK